MTAKRVHVSPAYTDAGAFYSSCRTFRYRLWRRWGDSSRVLVFLMLNPSTADHLTDDHTIRKCVGFASRAGHTGIEVINLFAFRATDPRDLKAHGYLIGPQNTSHAQAVFNTYKDVVCAWGNASTAPPVIVRARTMISLARDAGCNLKALALSANGFPRHPLMLPYGVEWTPFLSC